MKTLYIDPHTDTAHQPMKDEQCRFGTQPLIGAMLIWEITNRCNLECLHCCTESGPDVPSEGEAGDHAILAAIREFPSIPVREVMFSGGEPFLRTKLPDFISLAAACGADVYVASNGTLIDACMADRLGACRIKRLDISLDGHDEGSHRALRVHPTSFGRTLRGIRECVARNIPLRVSTMVTPLNFRSLPELMALLVNEGVTSVVVSSIQGSSGRAKYHPHLALPVDVAPELAAIVSGVKEKHGGSIAIDCRVFRQHSSAPAGCPAGRSVLHISPVGDVSPCSWLYKLNPRRFTLGNIKSLSFHECVQRSGHLLAPYFARTATCLIPYATL